MLNDYSGRVAFWERYEKCNILQKRNLLMPVAKKIMKEERKPCFKAVKKSRKWMLEPISA